MYNFVMNKITSIHKDHRSRVRGKFEKVGLDGFADHEVLELLLFYAIPYKDTNPIAHNLLSEFGSIENVFAASKDDLVKVKGISENSATLIKLIPALYSKLSKDLTKHYTHIGGWNDALKYCSLLFATETKEQVYIICLDNKNEVRSFKLISSGNASTAVVDTKQLTKFVLNKDYDKVILAHNHPIGKAEPSNEDIMFTKHIVQMFSMLNIDVVDHCIISPTEAYSMAHEGILFGIKESLGIKKSVLKVSDKKLNEIYSTD